MKTNNMSPHEQMLMNKAIARSISKGWSYVKVRSIHWRKDVGWYGQTTRVNFADDKEFIEGLKERKND